jgi:hypothetical protein
MDLAVHRQLLELPLSEGASAQHLVHLPVTLKVGVAWPRVEIVSHLEYLMTVPIVTAPFYAVHISLVRRSSLNGVPYQRKDIGRPRQPKAAARSIIPGRTASGEIDDQAASPPDFFFFSA